MKATGLIAAALLVVSASSGEAADPRPRVLPVEPQVIYASPPTERVIEPVLLGIQRRVVEQGPYYSGPNLMDYEKPIFHEDQPIRAYPYVRTWEAAHAVEPAIERPRAVPLRRLN
jgi:hypothetical protein